MLKSEDDGVTRSLYMYRKDYTWVSVQVIGPYQDHTTWQNTRDGVSNPYWRWQVSRGINATTPYSIYKRKLRNFSADGEVTMTDIFGRTAIFGFWGYPFIFESIYGGLPDPVSLDAAAASRLAREQFVKKYRERRTAFQGGVFLGELKQTIQMIRNPAKALREGIDRYYRVAKKRTRQSKPSQRRRVIRDTWLEFQFGWRPLISDIEDACRLATLEPFRCFETINALGTVNETSTTTKRTVAIWDALYVNYVLRLVGSVSCRIKGAVSYENNPPSFPEQLGLSWSNVLPTAWEIIPYSFLLDYFTNIGKVIEGVSTGTISLAWGCQMVTKKNVALVEGGTLDMANLKAKTPEGGSSSGYATLAGELESIERYERGGVTKVSYGLRDFYTHLPGSDTKWLNIAALKLMRR